MPQVPASLAIMVEDQLPYVPGCLAHHLPPLCQQHPYSFLTNQELWHREAGQHFQGHTASEEQGSVAKLRQSVPRFQKRFRSTYIGELWGHTGLDLSRGSVPLLPVSLGL